jgi:Protein of unknown function (DUF3641)
MHLLYLLALKNVMCRVELGEVSSQLADVNTAGRQATSIALPFVVSSQDISTCACDVHRAELGEAYGIVFSRLFALNNMPIKRYVDYLRQREELETYMETLVNAFNPSAAEVRPL